MTKASEEFRSALHRALSMIEAVGKGSVRQNISQRSALVELMVLQVRAGEVRPAVYLQHPPHLPEGKELQALLASVASKDQQLRLDAIEWASINRREAGIAGVTLRNAIEATRIAEELLNDPDAPEELHTWKHEIDDYVRTTFAVDTRTAPHERSEFDAWCHEQVSRANPCPLWLRTWRPGQTVAEKPKSVAEEFARHMSRTGGDDDE